jgi:8-oxo-dGTP diphosphatase
MTRVYPAAPICAVGGIIFEENSVLLTQRLKPPGQNKWSIPGGRVRLGETLEAAVIRELWEETSLEVRPIRIGKVLDRISRDPDGRVSFHYVIVDYVCQVIKGEPKRGSDAADVGYFEMSTLDALNMTEGTAEVIREVYDNLNTGKF